MSQRSSLTLLLPVWKAVIIHSWEINAHMEQ